MWALKRDFPELQFSLNGVVQDCHEAAAALQHEEAGARLHGVMIGRAAYHGPWASLGNADRAVFGAATNAAANRREVSSIKHHAYCVAEQEILCGLAGKAWLPCTPCTACLALTARLCVSTCNYYACHDLGSEVHNVNGFKGRGTTR